MSASDKAVIHPFSRYALAGKVHPTPPASVLPGDSRRLRLGEVQIRITEQNLGVMARRARVKWRATPRAKRRRHT